MLFQSSLSIKFCRLDWQAFWISTMKIFTRCPTNSYHVVWSQILQTCPTKRYPINFLFSFLVKTIGALILHGLQTDMSNGFLGSLALRKEFQMNFRNKKVFGAPNILRFKNESLEDSGSGVLNL